MNLEIFQKISSKEFKKELERVKEYFDKASNLREGVVGCYDNEPNSRTGKIIKSADYAESLAQQNCDIYVKTLGLDYDTVIDLVFDYSDTLLITQDVTSVY